jgi:signal peptidase I
MRVVGLPGDRIGMIDGKVRLNGRIAEYGTGQSYPLNNAQAGVRRNERLPGESVTHMILELRRTPQDNVPEMVVPANRFYMLGDNRDNSSDSRFALAEGGIETVAFDDVYGVIDPAFTVRGKPKNLPAPAGNQPEVVPVEPQ